jgi:hypothetical protein
LRINEQETRLNPPEHDDDVVDDDHDDEVCMISGYRRSAKDILTLLECYAVLSSQKNKDAFKKNCMSLNN